MKSKVLGIIGGGQLARMLCEAAKSLGIRTVVLLAPEDESSLHVADETFVGSLRDSSVATAFLKKIEYLTFENEFIDVDLVKTCLEQTSAESKLQIAPSLTSLQIAQDKLRQKELFHRLHIQTAKHVQVETEADLTEAAERLGLPFVLKWSKYGYDGKGNFVFRDVAQTADAMKFISASHQRQSRTFAEAFVSYDSEAAMVFCRSRSGALEHLPIVKTVQFEGACKTVEGPMTRMGWPASLESQALQVGHMLGEALMMTGTFAVEFFVCGNKLLVNEMAPRVHNSGHFSLLEGQVSQFENHVRAVCGLAVQTPSRSGYFGMLNLLGPKDINAQVDLDQEGLRDWMKDGAGQLDKRLFPYWYGKSGIRAGRKLGHINVKADSIPELIDGMLMAQEAEKRLWQNLARSQK